MTSKLKNTQPQLLFVLAAVFILLFGAAGKSIAVQVSELDSRVGQETTLPDEVQQEQHQNIADAANSALNINSPNQSTVINENDFDALSARAWMKRLANTIQQTSFEINFVVSSPRRETMPYVWRHAVLDSGETAEQLSLLNGPGFEQIRINNKVSIFEPGFAPISIRASAIDGPIPSAFIHSPDILNNGYDVLLMGRNRVSGRMAQQIRVISKDKSRYQYHLWLDEQTGLLLKQNMYDNKGVLLEQIQVTQLKIDDEVKENFEKIQAEQLPPVAATDISKNQQLPWTVSYMPVGMQMVAQNLRRIAVTGQPAEYLMLSDGLVDISIYVMQAADVSQEDLAVTTDATSVVSISDGRLQVTVIGEVPIETANKIANSIVLIEKP